MGVSAAVLLSILSASLLAVSQPPTRFGALALFALAPWWLAVHRSGPTRALALGALTATIYGCLVATWIPEAIRELGSTPLTSVTGLVVTAAWAKLPLFVPLALVLERTKRMRPFIALPLACVAVFLLESVVSSASWGVPWALIGHSQLEFVGVAQLAVVGGVPLVSALVFAVNGAIARGELRASLALVGAWIALAVFGLPVAELARPAQAGERHDLLLVQPDIPRGERWGEELQALNLQRVSAFVERLPKERRAGVSALVLPENLLTSPVDARPELESALQRWVDALRVPILTGLAMNGSHRAADLYRGAVVWIEPRRGVVARLDKVRAVPVLESSRELPGHGLLAPLFGSAARWKKVEEVPRRESGPLQGSFSVTPVLCYEALFPGLVADRRARDSVAILNLADDGWVAGDTATRQLTAFATFRAIEQRLPLIRVAHGGLSVVTDEFGRTVQSLPLDQYASARVTVRAHAPPTLCEKILLLGLPICGGLVVWWAAGFARRNSE